MCVNIGYKSDGLIPVAELINQENHREAYKVGDEIEVEVVKVNDGEGNVLLSQKQHRQPQELGCSDGEVRERRIRLRASARTSSRAA